MFPVQDLSYHTNMMMKLVSQLAEFDQTRERELFPTSSLKLFSVYVF